MSQSNQGIRSTPSGVTAGERLFLDYDGSSTPGGSVTCISYTVPVGKTVYILATHLNSKSEGDWTLEVDGGVIGSGRTGPARPSPSSMDFIPFHEVPAGSTIDVKFEQESYRPASILRAYLQGRLVG